MYRDPVKRRREAPRNDIEKNYIIGKTLGEGTFSTVKLSEHRITGEKVLSFMYLTAIGGH